MTQNLPFRVLMLLPDEDGPSLPANAALGLASSYFLFRDAGLEVAFTSRRGGFSSVSAELRRLADHPPVARMLADPFARDELADAIPLANIFVEDFDVLVLFVTDEDARDPQIAHAMSRFERDGKQVVATCRNGADDLAWADGIIERHEARPRH
jgi:putative intracellular protease/amidase